MWQEFKRKLCDKCTDKSASHALLSGEMGLVHKR